MDLERYFTYHIPTLANYFLDFTRRWLHDNYPHITLQLKASSGSINRYAMLLNDRAIVWLEILPARVGEINVRATQVIPSYFRVIRDPITGELRSEETAPNLLYHFDNELRTFYRLAQLDHPWWQFYPTDLDALARAMTAIAAMQAEELGNFTLAEQLQAAAEEGLPPFIANEPNLLTEKPAEQTERPIKKQGRTSHPENDWAREAIAAGQNERAVFEEWKRRRADAGRPPELQSDPWELFRKTIRPRRGRNK